MEVTNNKRLVIRFIFKDGTGKLLKSVMGYAYGYHNNKMEVGFSDGYVETYDMENVTKIEIE